jgi:hypothetical protein
MTHGILRELCMRAQTPSTAPKFVGEFAHTTPSTTTSIPATGQGTPSTAPKFVGEFAHSTPSIPATAQGIRSWLTPSGGGGGGGQATPSPHNTQAAQVYN